MAVLKEFVCLAHGAFTSASPRCPHGCTTTERRFFNAPGIRSNRTRGIDRTLDSLAASAGLTDMSNRSGSVLGGGRGRAAPPVSRDYRKFLEEKFAGQGQITPSGNFGMWGGVPSGGTYQPGLGARGEKPGGGAPGAPEARHVQPDNALAQVKDTLPSVASQTVIRRDHERLTVDVARAAP